MADDEEEGARRRLLQDLEQRIGGAGVHVVGGIDDGDAPAGLAAGIAVEGDGAADLVDGERALVAVGALVERPLQHQQVGMRPPHHLAEGGMVCRQRQVGGRRHRPARRIGMGEQEAGEAIGERRLADALGAADQPGMVHAAAAIGVEQRALGRRVAEPLGPLLRRRPALDGVEARHLLRVGGGHQTCPCRARPGGRGARPPPARRPRRPPPPAGWHRSRRSAPALAPRSSGRPAAALRGARCRRARSGPASCRSRPCVRRRGQCRPRPGMSRMMVRSGRVPPTATRSSASRKAGSAVDLIDVGRIEEAVGEHPVAGLERRADDVLDVVGAGGGEQHRLAVDAELLGEAGEQQPADRLGRRRAARLAGQHAGDAGAPSAARPAAGSGSTCRPPRRLRT